MNKHILLHLVTEESPEFVYIYLQSNRAKVRSNAVTSFKFNLDACGDEECLNLFLFKRGHLHRLKAAMNIPATMRCSNGTVFTGIEGLCILLRRLAYPNRLFDLTTIFGRSKCELSLIVKTMLDFIYSRFGNLVTSLNHWWLRPTSLDAYCAAISLRGSPLKNCWGFIDGTVRSTCRPGKNQRELYNGHKRIHGLKFQSVVTPNGLMSNVFGPVPGRRHDCYLLAQSNLLNEIEVKMTKPDGNVYCLYGDPAYPLRAHLIGPYRDGNPGPYECEFNKIMSSLRVSVEWEFGKMVSLFAFLDFKKNMKLYLQPIAKYYIVGTILKNCHACLYGCQTSQYFELETPTLENYLQNIPE